MLSKLARFKPGGQRKSHLLLAACLWTTVGTILMGRGTYWLYGSDLLVLILPAILLGTLKSHFILDKTAKRSIYRIQLLADGTCLGAVYSKKTWLLVLFMMVFGMLLRHSSLPRPLLGMMYIIVGWALFWSSRNGWQAWRTIQDNHE
jgi:hypothetical protein